MSFALKKTQFPFVNPSSFITEQRKWVHEELCLFARFSSLLRKPTQRKNECACSADLWFERESITNALLQSPNSHLLPQYFFCWIRYVMEEVRRNLSWKRQPYLFWFGLIHAKRKQTMGIWKMPPFCRVRLLTGDEHAYSFCRCVEKT